MTMSASEAARLLATDVEQIYRWAREDALPSHRVNDQLRFHETDLLEWATGRGLKVAVSQMPSLAAAETQPLPLLSEALAAGGVHPAIAASDRAEALRGVVAVMRLPEGIDREFVFQVLLSRETLGSTGVGDGIAIPHVRNPLVLHVTRPTLALCYLAQPIDFDAPDGMPVDTLFSLIASTTRVHLHLLSRLAQALHDSRFKAAVKRQAPEAEILREARRVEASFSTVPKAH